MELDDLKIRLKSKMEADHVVKTTGDLQKAIHANTKSITGKIKRSLWIELVFCIAMTMVLTVVAFITTFMGLRIYFGIFSVVCLVFIFILLLLLRKMNKLSNTAEPIKENLEKIISIISEYMLRYFQLSMFFIPVCIILSAWLSMHEPTRRWDDFFSFRFSKKTAQWIFLGVFYTVFTIGMYYFTKWYLKKLYGKYLDKLKEQLKELENG